MRSPYADETPPMKKPGPGEQMGTGGAGFMTYRVHALSKQAVRARQRGGEGHCHEFLKWGRQSRHVLCCSWPTCACNPET